MIKLQKLSSRHSDILHALDKAVFCEQFYTLKSITEELKSPNRLYFGAFYKDRLIGFIGVNILTDAAEIMKIGVVKEYRRQGVASTLLNKSVEQIKLHGVKTLSLEVNNNNDNAIIFYEKMGFVKVSVRKNYYKNGDAIILIKHL